MRAVRLESRRRIAFLVAEKSMRRKFIGWLSRCVGAVPVSRALDMTKPGTGRIYLPDSQQPLKIRGVGTKFTEELVAGGLLVLPPAGGQSAASAEVIEILSDEEVVLKREFKGDIALSQLTQKSEEDGKGSKYKVAPKVDQSQVYDAVFQRLNSGGCVGIFPEGGSHDRTELLPLKGRICPVLLVFHFRYHSVLSMISSSAITLVLRGVTNMYQLVLLSWRSALSLLTRTVDSKLCLVD